MFHSLGSWANVRISARAFVHFWQEHQRPRAYGREVNVWSPADRPSAFAVLAPASLAICALLALPCVRAVCWPLVEPPTHLLFRPPPERDGTSPGYSI